jgi:hypothetical protein
MLRRPFIEVPMSRMATWSARFGWFAMAVAVLSIVVLRTDVLEIEPAMATFGAALVFAALAVLLALAAFVLPTHSCAGSGSMVFGSQGTWISSR